MKFLYSKRDTISMKIVLGDNSSDASFTNM